MPSPASTPPLRCAGRSGRSRSGAALIAGIAIATGSLLAASGVTPAAAAPKKPKTLKAKAIDDKGDAPTPSVDIVKAKATYEKSGAVTFSVTTAGSLDFSKANEFTVLFAGKNCERNLFAAGVDLTDPTAPWAYRFSKPRSVDGRGRAKGTTYSATFRNKELANQKPAFFQIAIYPPGGSPDPVDQTDCAALA